MRKRERERAKSERISESAESQDVRRNEQRQGDWKTLVARKT